MAENQDRNEIYSQRIRAGKRTYFFDVRETRAGDRYLTITESKRKHKENDEGFYYEKHKLFLYKEDFDKFETALTETLEYIKSNLPPQEEKTETTPESESTAETTTKAKTIETSDKDTETKTTEDSSTDADADTELTWE